MYIYIYMCVCCVCVCVCVRRCTCGYHSNTSKPHFKVCPTDFIIISAQKFR